MRRYGPSHGDSGQRRRCSEYRKLDRRTPLTSGLNVLANSRGPEMLQELVAELDARGAHAEYLLATASRLVRLPEGTDWDRPRSTTPEYFLHGCRRAWQGYGRRPLRHHRPRRTGMTGARIAAVKGATVYCVEPKDDSWGSARHQGLQKVVRDVSERIDLRLHSHLPSARSRGRLRAWCVVVRRRLQSRVLWRLAWRHRPFRCV